MPKLRDNTIESRFRIRLRGGPPRFYADFRDFEDVGGKVERLCSPGEHSATTSDSQAKVIAEARLEELKKLRAVRPVGAPASRTFGKFAAHHLEQKAVNDEADEQWLAAAERHLAETRAYFGEHRDLARIQVADISAFLKHLTGLSNGRGGTMSSGSINHYLNSLSSMFRRAISEGIVPMGHNPVGALITKPKIRRTRTLWLEIMEMAAILKFAREYTSPRDDLAIPYFFEVLATTALTGCRETEVYGLQAEDINLDRGIIVVQPNEWRRLKTEQSDRIVPIFPQLGEILYAYMNGPHAPKGKLAFPSMRTEDGEERMITDLRKAYDKMPMPKRFERKLTAQQLAKLEAERQAKIARWTNGHRGPKPKQSLEELRKPLPLEVLPPLRSKMLRHTYCAARLQTTDHGELIATAATAIARARSPGTFSARAWALARSPVAGSTTSSFGRRSNLFLPMWSGVMSRESGGGSDTLGARRERRESVPDVRVRPSSGTGTDGNRMRRGPALVGGCRASPCGPDLFRAIHLPGVNLQPPAAGLSGSDTFSS